MEAHRRQAWVKLNTISALRRRSGHEVPPLTKELFASVACWEIEPHSRAGPMPRSIWPTQNELHGFVCALFCFGITFSHWDLLLLLVFCFDFHFWWFFGGGRTQSWMGRKVRKVWEELLLMGRKYDGKNLKKNQNKTFPLSIPCSSPLS